MTRLLTLVLAVLISSSAFAADPALPEQDGLFREAGDVPLEAYLWVNRPIIVFADTPADPRFQQQIELLKQGEDMLEDRDVVVLTDTDPAARSPVRQKLRPRGFQLVLVDKDGVVKLRKPFPWSVREITRSIDKTALRMQEVEERRGSR